MAYLRKGITWIPEYTLKVLDDDNAELTLRGTLVNEAEDLIHTDVHLVVGVPHFVHTEYMAPAGRGPGDSHDRRGRVVAPRRGRDHPDHEPRGPRPQHQHGAAVRPARRGQRSRCPAPAAIWPEHVGNLPQLGGAAATDYTVYTKKDLTLRRGEKAIVTLFTQKIQLLAHLPLVAARRRWSTRWCCTTRPTRPGRPAPAWP